MKNKLSIGLISLCLLLFFPVSAQKKIDGKRIKETKEWRVEGKKRVLDQVSRYDNRGEKIEEIEYNSVGDLKRRITFEYNDAGKCIKEVHYDKFNKLEKTVTFEHFENGKKKLQTTYLPNGKLSHTKEFEYILE